MPDLAIDAAQSPAASNTARRTGITLSALAVSFLLFDTVIKMIASPEAVTATVELGYPASVLTTLWILEAVLLVLYLVPRTAILGAILWTGYLGGAIATHVRLENPLFSHVLFPVYVALLLWGGLWLRDARLRSIVPLKTTGV